MCDPIRPEKIGNTDAVVAHVDQQLTQWWNYSDSPIHQASAEDISERYGFDLVRVPWSKMVGFCEKFQTELNLNSSKPFKAMSFVAPADDSFEDALRDEGKLRDHPLFKTIDQQKSLRETSKIVVLAEGMTESVERFSVLLEIGNYVLSPNLENKLETADPGDMYVSGDGLDDPSADDEALRFAIDLLISSVRLRMDSMDPVREESDVENLVLSLRNVLPNYILEQFIEQRGLAA